jgi:hypothetical protein
MNQKIKITIQKISGLREEGMEHEPSKPDLR